MDVVKWGSRLGRVERRLPSPGRGRSVSLHVVSPDVQPLPDWAAAAIEPYTWGGALVIWRGDPGDGALYAAVNGGTLAEQAAAVTPDRWYRVTEADVQAIERPVLFTVELDEPHGAGDEVG